jgi:hypothetical protein
VFPEGELDADLQQVRKTNSWRLRLGQIETTEMIEVQLVNSVAPFFCVTAFGINEERQYRQNTSLMFRQWKGSFIAF